MERECIFCTIASNESEELWNRPVFSSESYFIIAGRGQISEGYLIICAKSHINNMAELSYDQWEELTILKGFIKKLVEDIFGSIPCFFEHGDYSNCRSAGSCIKHAHLHVVALSLEQCPSFLTQFEVIDFKKDSDEKRKKKLQTMAPYFYLELSNGQSFALQNEILPCQFGRQLMVQEFNLKTPWDWRSLDDSEEMIKCIKKYQDRLEANFCRYRRLFPALKLEMLPLANDMFEKSLGVGW